MTIDNQNVGLRRIRRPRPTSPSADSADISALTVTRRTARVELARSQLVQERSLLAHPTLSSYGNFPARSARTGPTSGTRASGRIDSFGAPLGNDCCMRTAAVRRGVRMGCTTMVKAEALVLDRGKARRAWAGHPPSRRWRRFAAHRQAAVVAV